MKVLFRTDASIQIGTGHVMRCLTLANALREQGAQCAFVCRPHPGHLADRIRTAGHALHLLPSLAPVGEPDPATSLYERWLGCPQEQDAAQTIDVLNGRYDWLVADHYGLGAPWERLLRSSVDRILAIDDLANRAHDCDVLLDQNLGRVATDYDALVPSTATRLIGPRYALLRPEFAQLRAYSLNRRRQPRLRHILVSLGGIDKDNVTSQVLDALQGCKLPSDCRVTVVMGRDAPGIAQVREKAATFGGTCEVLVNIDNMAQLMADSDLAIGAAGTTSWERCCLGLPTVTIALAENQNRIAAALEEAGVGVVNSWRQPRAMCRLSAVAKPEWLRGMTDACARLVDGLGCDRVARFVREMYEFN